MKRKWGEYPRPALQAYAQVALLLPTWEIIGIGTEAGPRIAEDSMQLGLQTGLEEGKEIGGKHGRKTGMRERALSNVKTINDNDIRLERIEK